MTEMLMARSLFENAGTSLAPAMNSQHRLSVPLEPILTTLLNRSSFSTGECGFIAEQAACGVKDYGGLALDVTGPWLKKQASDMGVKGRLNR
jgi:hypothetical protein